MNNSGQDTCQPVALRERRDQQWISCPVMDSSAGKFAPARRDVSRVGHSFIEDIKHERVKRLHERGFAHVSEAIGAESGRWGKRSRRKKLKMAVTVELSLYAAFLLILLLNILLTFPKVVRWLANFAVEFTGMLPGGDREDDDA